MEVLNWISKTVWCPSCDFIAKHGTKFPKIIERKITKTIKKIIKYRLQPFWRILAPENHDENLSEASNENLKDDPSLKNLISSGPDQLSNSPEKIENAEIEEENVDSVKLA